MKNTFLKHSRYIGFIILVTCFFCIGICFANKEDKKVVILSINGVDIYEEEYRMFLQDEKALASNYFTQNYNAEYGEDFWNTKYGEETPIKYAREKALEELVKIKVEGQLATKYGILKDISYEEIKKEMKKDKSIYGVQNMEPLEAYKIYHSKIVLKTLEKFKQIAPPIPENQLKEKYEEMKTEFFNQPDDLKILELKISPIQENQGLLNAVRQDLQAGIRLRDLKEKYRKVCTIEEAIIDYGQHESKEASGTEVANLLKEKAYGLQTSQMTEPFICYNQPYILVCLERREGEVVPFETAKIKIEEQLKEEIFDEEVKQQMKKATVKIVEEKYEKLQMD